MLEYSGLYVDDYTAYHYAKQDFERKEPLKATDIENGIILPVKRDPTLQWGLGGVLNPDHTFFEKSGIPGFFGGSYDYDQDNIVTSDETVIYMGPFLQHWGHFLCDMISRLWYILPDVKKFKVAYCGWNWGQPSTSMTGNFLEFMHLLGLNDDQLIDIQSPTQFRHIIIPEISFKANEYYCPEFSSIFKKVSSSIQQNDYPYYEKVYFSRGKFPIALEKERGEETLIRFFKKNDYKILMPEKLSLREQIYYYKYSKQIAALGGSIAHSIVFAHDDLEFTILNKMGLVNDYQKIIDSMMKIKITYVDVFLSDNPVCFGIGPFLLGISNHMKQYAIDRHMKIPYSTFLSRREAKKHMQWYTAEYERIYSNETNKALLSLQTESLNYSKNVSKL